MHVPVNIKELCNNNYQPHKCLIFGILCVCIDHLDNIKLVFSSHMKSYERRDDEEPNTNFDNPIKVVIFSSLKGIYSNIL